MSTAPTDRIVPDALIDLPPEAGDPSAARFEPDEDWLRRASPTQQKAAMWRWFATRYEEPRQAVPHDAGGDYLYTDGGPYHVDEVLHERFDRCVPREVVAELAARVQHTVGRDWAKKGLDKAGA